MPDPSDPLVRLAALEGVASAMAATRDGIDALLRDRGLRRTTPDLTAESLLRGRALSEGLAYEVLATRADLNRVVAAVRRGDPEPDVRVLRGWRREVAGEDLLALLAGRRGISVDPDGHLRVSMSEDEPG